MPTRDQLPPPGRPRVDAPALPEGEGLVLVANKEAGAPDRVRLLRDVLPGAEVIECEAAELRAELERAAKRAVVLGVCGGDGSVNAAAEVAVRHSLPLAVLPGGTLNHFAHDLGVEDVRDLSQAVRHGDAVRVDVGYFKAGDVDGCFLNTCSLGVYPELVRERDRWSRRIGGWPAGVLAALRVLRADRHPLRTEIGGTERPLWLLFVEQRHVPPHGPDPRPPLRPRGRPPRRTGRARGPQTRRPAARRGRRGTADPLPVHAAVRVGGLRVDGVAPGTLLAYDGEVTSVEGELTLEKLPEALTVYRPLAHR